LDQTGRHGIVLRDGIVAPVDDDALADVILRFLLRFLLRRRRFSRHKRQSSLTQCLSQAMEFVPLLLVLVEEGIGRFGIVAAQLAGDGLGDAHTPWAVLDTSQAVPRRDVNDQINPFFRHLSEFSESIEKVAIT
jgi:hypothetical protein